MWSPGIIQSDKPKYLAIADALEEDVAEGRVLPGEQLPPQRELADMLSVNLSTVSRAYSEMEKRGLTAGKVGKGTFVSADVSVSLELIHRGEQGKGQIEMGLVFPLYQSDPDLQQRLVQLAAGSDLSSHTKYSDPCGLQQHLEAGANWVRRFGLTVPVNHVMVTAGAQHALTCAFASCFKPGSRIAVDHLTYPGIKALAAMMHIRLVPIQMDGEGMIPEQLEIGCRSNPIEGVYLMPCCQNPTGIEISDGRREELVALIKKYNLLLIEDDAYYFTAENSKPAMSKDVPDNSIFIAGFSKILFAGLRSSFVICSPKIREKMSRAVLNTIWMAPTLNTSLLCEAIADGTVDAVIDLKLQEAKARNLLVNQQLSYYRQTCSSGSFFHWCELPEPWTAIAFEECARKNGVNVFCGDKFSVGSQAISQHIRFSVTSVETREELSAGLEILNEIVEGGMSPFGAIN